MIESTYSVDGELAEANGPLGFQFEGALFKVEVTIRSDEDLVIEPEVGLYDIQAKAKLLTLIKGNTDLAIFIPEGKRESNWQDAIFEVRNKQSGTASWKKDGQSAGIINATFDDELETVLLAVAVSILNKDVKLVVESVVAAANCALTNRDDADVTDPDEQAEG